MNQEPRPGPSSTWAGLFAVLRPFLLCAALFWVGPDELVVLARLLDHAPAY